jgi:hypothetical protein
VLHEALLPWVTMPVVHQRSGVVEVLESCTSNRMSTLPLSGSVALLVNVGRPVAVYRLDAPPGGA